MDTNGEPDDELPGDVMDPACPSRSVLRRMTERWTPLVIRALADGPLRFTALRSAVGGVTGKVLTQTLRGLEQDGMLTRQIYPEIPPRVEYALTDLGESLLVPLEANIAWAQTHLPEVLAARERWDDRVLGDAG